MKLSVITINRNNTQGLEATILSVIQQTYVDYEYIIIDGGSTDGSLSIIEQYAEKINFWVSEPDKGIYNAMNKGIQQSKGEYCIFLNSGDCLVNNSVLSDVFNRNADEDILYGNLVRKKGIRNYRISKFPEKLTFYHFYDSVSSIHQQAAFIKRNLFNKYGVFREDLRIIADWEFFFRCVILKNCSTKYLNINISIFDSFGLSSDPQNTESSLKLKILQEHFPSRVLDDYEDLVLFKKSVSKKIKDLLINTKLLYRLLRFIYIPVMKIKELISYNKINKV